MKLLARRQTFSLHKPVASYTCGCLVTEEGEGAATEGELGEAAETEEKEKDEEKEEKESQEGDAAKGRVLVEWGCCAWRLCLCVLGLN